MSSALVHVCAPFATFLRAQHVACVRSLLPSPPGNGEQAALQMTRGQVRTTRAESDTASEAVEVLKAELAKTATEMKALRCS